MKLERPLAILDIESTGIDPVADRIIDFGVVTVFPDGTRSIWSQRFNPGIPIPPSGTEVHGITDADVKDCPTFDVWAARIFVALRGKDLGGYNIWRFDLPILDEEMRRCGGRLDLTGVRVIDCYQIFAAKESRSLEAAVKKYCGREHEDAHGAVSDALATADVLNGQLAAYPDLESMSLADLADFSRHKMDDDHLPVDLAGKLYQDADGYVCYGFGKAKGERVADDPGFGEWMFKQKSPGFPGSTLDALNAEFERLWPRKQGKL